MGQAETKEGKRSSLGSNQSPISPQAAHHPHDQRASTPTPSLMNSLDRTKQQRSRRASHEDTIKDDPRKTNSKPQSDFVLPVGLPGAIVPVIEQLRGRRSRRPSVEQGPINMKSPIKSLATDTLTWQENNLPQIPASEIFVPDKAEADEGKTTPFRGRASTIGNGQIPRLAAKNDNNIDETEVNKADRSNIKVQVVLRYTKTKTTKRVFVAGSMTQWKTLEMGHCTGETTFDLVLECTPGKYYYKFFVDNEWVIDESLPTTSYFRRPSGHAYGAFGQQKNVVANVIVVKAEDNEVFEALACDSFSIKSDNKYPEKGWGQNKPNFDDQKSSNGGHSGPPILPPHLLSIVLNKEVTDKSDPVLLPEPTSHVMLNHLYAQSIRDQMLVMATTARYKKKCVTIFYYSPFN